MESALSVAGAPPGLEIRMLGPLIVRRDGCAVRLPASRKVRGLLARLLLARNPMTRSELCELLWDVPNDPRGELRWCLSKVRALVDGPERPRVLTDGDTIDIDTASCFVDGLEIERDAQVLETLDWERIRSLEGWIAGEFLAGLEIDGCAAFSVWLEAQRRRFRLHHTRLLEHLAKRAPADAALAYLERWLELAPHDPFVHQALLEALVQRDRTAEAQEHVAATVRRFEDEGLEAGPIHDAWRRALERDSRAAPGATVRELELNVRAQPPSGAARRASLTVMPFADHSDLTGLRGGMGDALAHDVITRLAKLRSLFVIAQGSVFALHDRGIAPHEAGRMLNVDYVAGGSIQRRNRTMTVHVELSDARTGGIIWAEVYARALDDAFAVMEEIGNSIVASIASEIETSERNRAILRAPNTLDAWGSYHRGLWHMYRFNAADNELAQNLFRTAVRMDPTFARAHAALSFTHWQSAFQGWAERTLEIERAYEAAGAGMMADDRDPAAHWAMGRALWLRRRFDEAVRELEQTIDLSPNFALGHYTLGFVHAMARDPQAAITCIDDARRLSPYDPLLFAMMATKATALIRLGRVGEAIDWAVKAAGRPNAHAHILAIAALALALDGRTDEGRAYLMDIRKFRPSYSFDDVLTAYQFDDQVIALLRTAATRLDMT